MSGMSNVLPASARAKVMRIVRARFLMTGSLVFSAGAIVATLSLMPAYLSVVIPRMSLSGASPITGQERVQEESDRDIASRMRSLIAVLAPFSEVHPPVHDVIARVYAIRPSGIAIERIMYKAGSQGEITVVGTALSRDHVNAYREALEGETIFASVSVPVAALVGASAGNFTVTLKGTF